MALEDGSGIGRQHWELVVGGVAGRQLKMQQQRWVVPGAEEPAMMASASVSLKPRAYYYDICISSGKDGERGPI